MSKFARLIHSVKGEEEFRAELGPGWQESGEGEKR